MLTETITEITHFSPRIFTFRTTRSASFNFKNGEYCAIGRVIGDRNVFRAYSIASTNYDEHLEFVSIIAEDGVFTPDLVQCKIGDEIMIRPRTSGTLCADYLHPKKNLVMLSTGTGIAPFLGMVRDPYTFERFENVYLFHSVPYEADITHLDMLTKLPKEMAEIMEQKVNFKYIESVTREPYHREGRFWDHIGTYLEGGFNKERDGVSVCGNTELNLYCREYFSGLGFEEGGRSKQGDFLLEYAFLDR